MLGGVLLTGNVLEGDFGHFGLFDGIAEEVFQFASAAEALAHAAAGATADPHEQGYQKQPGQQAKQDDLHYTTLIGSRCLDRDVLLLQQGQRTVVADVGGVDGKSLGYSPSNWVTGALRKRGLAWAVGRLGGFTVESTPPGDGLTLLGRALSVDFSPLAQPFLAEFPY